jgi:hypothetical protein
MACGSRWPLSAAHRKRRAARPFGRPPSRETTDTPFDRERARIHRRARASRRQERPPARRCRAAPRTARCTTARQAAPSAICDRGRGHTRAAVMRALARASQDEAEGRRANRAARPAGRPGILQNSRPAARQGRARAPAMSAPPAIDPEADRLNSAVITKCISARGAR